MDKRRLNRITLALVALMVLAAALMLWSSLRRSSHITLPEPGPDPDQLTEGDAPGGDLPTVVAVTPETVQAAVETLTRPESYSRAVTVEQFWNGGSGTYEVTVAVRDGWTRTDRTLPDGRIRHAVTNGETTHIWYNDEKSVYTVPAGDISADNEQTIPTYEDILRLQTADITEADYRTVSNVNCIYVEAGELPEGYVFRYWVSVDTGLLVAAEKLLEGETVYRMGALTVDQEAPDASNFTLPDGTALLNG
ncbi:hypothetical protein [uncultured Dysosmobacter sp.]|uniref:hypothetical protein n=1 Tax=uncultured Dysosmobacter sp. TaxID=2591384 RepID=UPI00260685B0|nr:hypothetical protein [uncultured Dysosmobacter sp.]